MTSGGCDPPGRLAVTLAELAFEAVTPPTEPELERGLSAVRVRLAAARSRRRLRRRASLAWATATLLVAATFCGVSALRNRWPTAQPPVALERIEHGALLDGGYLSESGHGGIRLSFNEGSSFVLTPGTRGRLREVAKDGARFSLENGAASFQITPNAARRWFVEAGPFLVTVKGTIFSVLWDPVTERFELMLRRGQVVVDGPVAGGGIPLRAGQHLIIALSKAETIITEGISEDTAPRQVASSGPPAPKPAAATKHASVAVAPARPTARTGAGGLGWAQLLAVGRWDRILAEVDRAGLDATLGSASSEDLLALADAARYRRRADLARAALLAQQRRFPGSAGALTTSFLLGRVEELSPDGAARAIALYDEYLARAPRGNFAAEALGRKMILTKDLGGRSEARPIAERYLLQFPSGSYAGAARALARAR
jgi:ferric-dicitrate binding protein FerR (iron transport regulator)